MSFSFPYTLVESILPIQSLNMMLHYCVTTLPNYRMSFGYLIFLQHDIECMDAMIIFNNATRATNLRAYDYLS